jgi:hypothetical protein
MSLPTEPFPILFARMAAEAGWRRDLLRQLCADRGISAAEMRRRWPRGARSVAWELNGLADAAMLDRFEREKADRTSTILLARFHQNRSLKRSVARLAFSDLFHPFDTLRRTAVTARAMWRCRDAPVQVPGHRLMLIFAYSVCVLIWLVDRSPDEERTRRWTLRLLRLARVD